jgi:ABC-type glycerol-3-phosphate transport system substrate-binding protein
MRKRAGAFQARLSTLPLALLFFLWLANAPETEAQTGWRKDWERTLEAAKKEGQVSLYICSTCSATNQYEKILAEFAKDYPGIKIVTVAGSGTQLSARETAERRAGKYLADIHGAAPTRHSTCFIGQGARPDKIASGSSRGGR